MGNYIVSARKYRPSTFESVVGQSHITRTLRSAILMDQLAHAFLFSGPRGVGKTTCARILAKAINCLNLTDEGEPCNSCDSCNSYNEGKSINIHELDAASNNSVDDIRNLIEQTRYVPVNGKRSVYIIDEVHMLSQAAFNAFLKTLEEPPPHVLFILATTEKHKILPTILSRCQKFDFRRIKVDDIAGHLEHISKEEGIEYEYAALQQIALKADGALRDALSLYDQLVSYSSGKLTFSSVLENLNILDYDYYFKAVDHIQQQSHKDLLLLLDEIIENGFEPRDFMAGLTEHFRNLLVCQTPETVKLLETSENVKEKYQAQSGQVPPTVLLNAFNLCTEAEQKLRYASHPRLVVELALLKLAYLESAISVVGNGATAEKKKPLNEVAEATENQPPPPTPKAVVQEPEKEISPAPKAEVIQKESVAEVSQPEVKPPVAPNRLKKRTAEFKLSNSIHEIGEAELAHTTEAKQDQLEKDIDYSLNPAVQIDKSLFDTAIAEFAETAKKSNKMNLISAFQNPDYTLHHNHWTLKVENNIIFNVVEREKESLLPFMRNRLKVPDLFMDMEIESSHARADEAMPYTEEEKLNVMTSKNDSLKRLQEIFKTRIIYQ